MCANNESLVFVELDVDLVAVDVAAEAKERAEEREAAVVGNVGLDLAAADLGAHLLLLDDELDIRAAYPPRLVRPVAAVRLALSSLGCRRRRFCPLAIRRRRRRPR